MAAQQLVLRVLHGVGQAVGLGGLLVQLAPAAGRVPLAIDHGLGGLGAHVAAMAAGLTFHVVQCHHLVVVTVVPTFVLPTGG